RAADPPPRPGCGVHRPRGARRPRARARLAGAVPPPRRPRRRGAAAVSAGTVPSEGALRSELVSPETGAALRADSDHSLTDGDTRWPVFEGIPYLRAGREEVRDAALAALDD